LNAHASGTPGASRLRYWAQLVFPTPKKTCLAPRPQKKQPHTHTHKNGNNNKQRPIWELGGGETAPRTRDKLAPQDSPSALRSGGHAGCAGRAGHAASKFIDRGWGDFNTQIFYKIRRAPPGANSSPAPLQLARAWAKLHCRGKWLPTSWLPHGPRCGLGPKRALPGLCVNFP
jgi:hypothetical protein